MQIHDLIHQLPTGTEITFTDVLHDGCIPSGAYLTTNNVEFFYYQSQWILPHTPRMDGVVRLRHENNSLEVVEMNKLHQHDRVVVGTKEDGSEGIFVASLSQKESTTKETFRFMSGNVSRERSVNYQEIAQLLHTLKKQKKNILWVLGPAVIHAGGIHDMEWLIQNGYVRSLFGGNAVAAHDIEHALFQTSLGNNDQSHPVPLGHRNHLEAISLIRQYGSIQEAVTQHVITQGIMYECITNHVPFVLAGSIRDDGPLPDVITDVITAQNTMRRYTSTADCIVMLASALHSIATGNMTPTYIQHDEEITSIPVICVDNDEFTVTKLADRGTSQVYPIIANVRDFLHVLVYTLKEELS